MKTMKHSDTSIPKEIPEPQKQPELIPPAEPVQPAIPMEDPHIGLN
jgi:hypothetical protein